MSEKKQYTPTKDYKRLDIYLSEVLETSRSAVSKLIKDGNVFIDSKPITKSSAEVKLSNFVEVIFPDVVKQKGKEVNFDIEVLYEDEDLLVVNKPSNLVVHPAPSVQEATLVDWLKLRGVSLSTISGEERHGIVHRIDKDTTGALIIAKNNEAHIKLSEQLQDKSMGRYYLAVINHQLKENIVVDKAIGRNPRDRKKMAIVSSGKQAKSAFAKIVTSKDEKFDLIAAKLFTGRTHQIRVHLGAIGRYILGDKVYGEKKSSIEGVLLHAYLLYFKHPRTEEMLLIEANLPKEFRGFLENNFTKDECDEKISKDSITSSFNFCS